ncbi:hypothetical protein M426DRAFT_264186, partial [Hypoxylon sp. CI-4A]
MAGIGTLTKTVFTNRVSHIFSLFLIAAAFALLIVDVTAPVSHNLALLSVKNEYIRRNEGYPVVRFGAFVYCLQIHADFSETYNSNTDPTLDKCTTTSINYYPVEAVSNISTLGSSTNFAGRYLTSAMVLHSIATAFVFLTLSSHQYLGEGGSFGSGMWMLVAAFVSLVLSTVFLVAEWWFGRRITASNASKDRGDINGKELEKIDADGISDIQVPPYELGNRPGAAELPQGDKAHRHELSDQDGGIPAELVHHEMRRELRDTHINS